MTMGRATHCHLLSELACAAFNARMPPAWPRWARRPCKSMNGWWLPAGVQWLREADQLPESGLRREAGEVELTGNFLSTFGCWLRNRSTDAGRSRAWLDWQLRCAEPLALHRPGNTGARPGWTRSPTP